MNKPRNIVGPVVKQMREERAMTQSMLVAKLNLLDWDISRETLAKIESQFRWVADFEVVILAKAFGMEGGELLKRASHSSSRVNATGVNSARSSKNRNFDTKNC